MLLSQGIGDDHEEELHNWLVGVLGNWLLLGARALAWNVNLNVVSEVRVDSVLEILDLRSVVQGHNVAVVYENVKTVLL